MKTGIVWLAECKLSNTEITEGQVRAAAQNLGKGYEIMETLLSQGKATITEKAIQAILRSFNGKIVRPLLDNNTDTKITEAMILAAAANRKSGRDVMGLLVDVVAYNKRYIESNGE
jgi:hypothetical protein